MLNFWNWDTNGALAFCNIASAYTYFYKAHTYATLSEWVVHIYNNTHPYKENRMTSHLK